MVRKRSTEIWHVPKRASIHQIVGSLNVLKHFEIDGKNWPNSRKLFDQKLAIWGFTTHGRSISKNASETLEALLKYLGLLVIVDGKLRITPAGYCLIDEHPVSEPSESKKKLNETIKKMGNITSEVLRHQMMKLVLTNPSVSKYCKNVGVAPFRETLILLLDDEIKYLSSEEMAMFLFRMRDKSERDNVKREIMEFRNLDESKKMEIVDSFRETPEGNLTLVQAPTVTYWKQLCTNTGLFEVVKKNLYLRETCKSEALELLEHYEDRVYTFDNNLRLWYEYYTVPGRNQPINITITPSIKGYDEYLLTISNKSGLIAGEVIKKDLKVEIPAFPHEEHEIKIIELQDGNSIYSTRQKFSIKDNALDIDVDVESVHKTRPDAKFFVDKINQLIESKTFDEDYIKQLGVVGKALGIDLLDKKRVPILRGGRLEFLFHKLLETLQIEGKISDLHWNGKVDKFGIAKPAPGKQTGLPDLTFKCEETYFVLELTTIKAKSRQWQAEGSSVPFHIRNFDETHSKKVIGIFATPIYHENIDKSIKRALIPERYTIISVEIDELVEILVSSDNLCNELNRVVSEQYEGELE